MGPRGVYQQVTVLSIPLNMQMCCLPSSMLLIESTTNPVKCVLSTARILFTFGSVYPVVIIPGFGTLAIILNCMAFFANTVPFGCFLKFRRAPLFNGENSVTPAQEGYVPLFNSENSVTPAQEGYVPLFNSENSVTPALEGCLPLSNRENSVTLVKEGCVPLFYIDN